MSDERISAFATAAPLELGDNIVVERGATPPNLKATIQQIVDLALAAGGSGTVDTIPRWVTSSSLGDSRISEDANTTFVNEGDSGVTAGIDFNDLVVESSVDGGVSVLVSASRIGGYAISGPTQAADMTYDVGTLELVIATHDSGGTIELSPNIGGNGIKIHADGSVTVGGTLNLTNMDRADLLLHGATGGALVLGDRAIPTADAGFSKVFTNNNDLYYQDGLGTTTVIALVGDPPSAHTIASHSDTVATGANLNTLVGGGNADALHIHALLAHTIAFHSDTIATGAELNTLTNGSNADTLHTHSFGTGTVGGTGTAGTLAMWSSGGINIEDSNIIQSGSNISIPTGNLTVTVGNVQIGSVSAQGKLHVASASAGAITPEAGADEAIFENSGAVGISFYGGTSSDCTINFGDSGDDNKGSYKFKNLGSTHQWYIAGSNVMQVNNTSLLVGSGIDFRMTFGAEVFLLLPTTAGTLGSLWSDAGTVKVA